MAQKLILDVNENPKKIRSWILFAFQHIFAMLVACITVAWQTGLAIGPTLISAGVGTIIYIIATKGKSPVFLASSFAYISAMIAALGVGVSQEGLQFITTPGNMNRNFLAVILGMILVGIIYVVVALLIKKFGTKWLNKLLPPVVIGPVIMVIGLGLATSAVANMNTVDVAGGSQYMSLLMGLVAMFITAICSHFGKKMVSLIPFVIGMGSAYVLSLILTLIGRAAGVPALQIVDLTPLTSLDWTSWKSYINVDFMFLNAINQEVQFTPMMLGSVFIIFAPVSLVTICEHIGDHKNVGNIIGRDLLNGEPGITRTLIGDGVATAVSGVLCGAANTTYGENVAVVGVTRIASVGVIFLASILTILFGFVGPLTAVLETMPKCITGGVSLILYGFIASSGVKMLINEKINFDRTNNMIIASVILVVGIGGLTISFTLGDSTATFTSTALSMILGIILNAILRDKKEDNLSEEEIDRMIEEQKKRL